MTPVPGCIHGTPVDRQCLACAYLAVLMCVAQRRKEEGR
jgi:hypothetical protein